MVFRVLIGGLVSSLFDWLFYVKPYGERGRRRVTCFSGFSVDSFRLWEFLDV